MASEILVDVFTLGSEMSFTESPVLAEQCQGGSIARRARISGPYIRPRSAIKQDFGNSKQNQENIEAQVARGRHFLAAGRHGCSMLLQFVQ